MIINRIHEIQNLLSLYFVSFLVGLRTYQHPFTNIPRLTSQKASRSSNECSFAKCILFIRGEKKRVCLFTNKIVYLTTTPIAITPYKLLGRLVKTVYINGGQSK